MPFDLCTATSTLDRLMGQFEQMIVYKPIKKFSTSCLLTAIVLEQNKK